MLRSHLPWYVNPSTACIDCQISEGTGSQLTIFHGKHQLIGGDVLLQAWFLLMNGLFLFIGLSSLDDLLVYFSSLDPAPRQFRFSEEELLFLREYDQRAGLEPLTAEQYMTFPPTRVIVLSNYLILSRLLAGLNNAAQIAFKSVIRYVNFDGSRLPSDHPMLKVGIIDSHFHMDILMLSSRTFTSQSGLKRSITAPARLLFAIANYVYPNKWSKIGVHMKDDRLKYTLGIHPHLITKTTAPYYLNKLEGMIHEHPEALGIGEIGLDFTTDCRHGTAHNGKVCRMAKINAQRQFLRSALQLTKRLNKVLILHVRDAGSGKAAEEVLALLLELGMSEHLIHRHCFTGGEAEYRAWSTSLPNCYFSLSPVSLQTPKTVAWLRVQERTDRLIIETDAPYLHKPNPWFVYHVAEGAAQYFNMTANELTRVCNKNVARLYSLPW